MSGDYVSDDAVVAMCVFLSVFGCFWVCVWVFWGLCAVRPIESGARHVDRRRESVHLGIDVVLEGELLLCELPFDAVEVGVTPRRRKCGLQLRAEGGLSLG